MNFNQFFGLSSAIAILSLILLGSSNSFAAPPITEPVDANIVNTPGVVVANTTLDPVVTQPRREGFDQASPVAYTSFTMGFTANMGIGDVSGRDNDEYVVPDGKRLVIEYASFDPIATPTAPDPGATYTAILTILSVDKLSAASHVLGTITPRISTTGTAGGITTRWEGGNMVRIYAGPGETIRGIAVRNWDTTSFDVVMNVTGYLETAN